MIGIIKRRTVETVRLSVSKKPRRVHARRHETYEIRF